MWNGRFSHHALRLGSERATLAKRHTAHTWLSGGSGQGTIFSVGGNRYSPAPAQPSRRSTLREALMALFVRRLSATRFFMFGNVLLGAMFLLGVVSVTGQGAPPTATSNHQAATDIASQDFKDELPRIPPLEPAEAIKSFQVQPGFRIEQVAAEPLVASPVAMAFDEDGRMYVVEMRDYSEDRKDQLGRIRLLEDTDGDGTFRQEHDFRRRLSWPTAVVCLRRRHIRRRRPRYLLSQRHQRRRQGRRAESRSSPALARQRARTVEQLSPGRSTIAFKWRSSSTGGEIRLASEPDKTGTLIRGRDFAFDPRTRDLRSDQRRRAARHELRRSGAASSSVPIATTFRK